MVDDQPCELDLSNWGMGNGASAPITDEAREQPSAMNEYEQFILDWGQQHPGEVLKARILLQVCRLFEGMQPDEVRLIFASMADKGLGEVEGNGDRLGWRWSK